MFAPSSNHQLMFVLLLPVAATLGSFQCHKWNKTRAAKTSFTEPHSHQCCYVKKDAKQNKIEGGACNKNCSSKISDADKHGYRCEEPKENGNIWCCCEDDKCNKETPIAFRTERDECPDLTAMILIAMVVTLIIVSIAYIALFWVLKHQTDEMSRYASTIYTTARH